MVTGNGIIRARSAASLTLTVLARDGRPSRTRVLFITPSTQVTTGRQSWPTAVGSLSRLGVGQSIYFTASADGPHLLTAPLYALRIIQTQWKA